MGMEVRLDLASETRRGSLEIHTHRLVVISLGICRGFQVSVKKWLEAKAYYDIFAVRKYAYDRIGDHAAAKEHQTLRIFEAARLFNFSFVKQNELVATDLSILQEVLPFVTANVLHDLEVEMDVYNTAASQTSSGYDLWAFWGDNREKNPAWFNVAQDIALIQPSSAFIERVFPLLRAALDVQQESSHSDKIAASVLLKYNRGSQLRL